MGVLWHSHSHPPGAGLNQCKPVWACLINPPASSAELARQIGLVMLKWEVWYCWLDPSTFHSWHHTRLSPDPFVCEMVSGRARHAQNGRKYVLMLASLGSCLIRAWSDISGPCWSNEWVITPPNKQPTHKAKHPFPNELELLPYDEMKTHSFQFARGFHVLFVNWLRFPESRQHVSLGFVSWAAGLYCMLACINFAWRAHRL